MALSNYNEWFCEIIEFYRDLEFFTHAPFNGLTEVECQRLLEGNHADWFRERFETASNSRGGEFLVASIIAKDFNRVWDQDAEWVYPDTCFYQEGIKRLGQISRNIFHPQNAHEECVEITAPAGEATIIHLSFDASDVNQNLWVTRHGDFANASFISVINKLIRQTGQQFRIFSDDQDWLVICQTDIEAAAMLQRGFAYRQMEPVSGILQYPDYEMTVDPHSRDRWLYAKRGFFRYHVGDEAGAWDDFRIATEFGVPNLYSQIAEMDRPPSAHATS